MSEPDHPARQPRLTDRAQAEKAARAEREAAALRANLRRRKDQARAREAGPGLPQASPANADAEPPTPLAEGD